MKNRWKSALKELRGNRGSGVVLVLVAISCITLMTTSLLHLSYTAFKIKASDRVSKADFYEADAKLDTLIAGIQEITSDAIAEAQKKVFVTYNESTSKSTFHAKVIEEMEKALKVSDSDKYNVSKLQAILTDPSVADPNVTIANDADSICVKDQDTDRFTLKNVRITYLSEKSGNYTTVKADIVIDCTELEYRYVKPGNTTIGKDSNKWNLEEIVTYENWSTY